MKKLLQLFLSLMLLGGIGLTANAQGLKTAGKLGGMPRLAGCLAITKISVLPDTVCLYDTATFAISVEVTDPKAKAANSRAVHIFTWDTQSANAKISGPALITRIGLTNQYDHTQYTKTSPVTTVFTAKIWQTGTYKFLVHLQDTTASCSDDSVITMVVVGIPKFTSVILRPASCGQPNGTIVVGISGGTPKYTYNYTTVPSQANGPYAALTDSAIAVAKGTYTVKVTDRHTCSKDTVVKVVELSGTKLKVTSTDETCFGACDGTISLTIVDSNTPKNSPYCVSVTGSTGNSVSPCATVLKDSLYTALCGGSWKVSITDSKGCVYDSIGVLIKGATQLKFSSIVTTSDIACSGGSGTIKATAQGGTPTYKFSISPDPKSYGVLTTNPATFGTLPPPPGNGLPTGPYTVTVIDSKGCSRDTLVNVGTNSTNSITLVPPTTNVSCKGGNNGVIKYTITGSGSYNIEVKWNGSNIPPTGTSQGPGTYTLTPLAAGTYVITWKDGTACEPSITVIITEPSTGISIVSIDQTPPKCPSGTGCIIVHATGGTRSYVYTIAAATGGPNKDSTFCGLKNATPYIVTVTDKNGCTATQTVTLTAPNPVTGAYNIVSQVTCNGGKDGSVILTASQGTTPYVWSVIPKTTTPTSGTIPGSNTVTGMAAGTYTFTYKDNNGAAGACIDTKQVIITEPAKVVVTEDVTPGNHLNVQCSGSLTGKFKVNVVGGKGVPYTVIIDSGDVYTTVNTKSPDGGTTYVFSGLTDAKYRIKATDGNGCLGYGYVTITAAVPMTIDSVSNVPPYGHPEILCYGGTQVIKVTVTGGTQFAAPPNSYAWTVDNLPVGGVKAPSPNNTLPQLVGPHVIIATDANGCSKSITVTLTQPADITYTTLYSNVSCNGAPCNGWIKFIVNGGTKKYVPQLLTDSLTGNPKSGVLSANGDTITYTGLCLGIYKGNIQDANGCTKPVRQQITVPTLLQLTKLWTAGVTCSYNDDGKASVLATGGTPPYIFVWTPGAPPVSVTNYPDSSHADNLKSPTVKVDVTDSKGCKASINLPIGSKTPVDPNVIVNPTKICIGQTAVLTSNATGGTPPYNPYTWDQTAPSPGSAGTGNPLSVSPTVPTTYRVTVTDANGCSFVQANILVDVYGPLKVTASVDRPSICEGSGAVNLSANGSGGNPVVRNYTWIAKSGDPLSPANGVGKNIQALNPQVGTNSYIVTFDDQCTATVVSDTVTVDVTESPKFTFTSNKRAGCDPLDSIRFSAKPPTNVPASRYDWDFNDGTTGGGTVQDTGITHSFRYKSNNTDISEYVVSLKVTSNNGCFATKKDTIIVYQNPTVAINSLNDYVTNLSPQADFVAIKKVSNDYTTGARWNWNFGDGTTALDTIDNAISHEFTKSGTFKICVKVTTNYNCIDTNCIYLARQEVTTVWIPDAFTPNGDDKNDVFKPVILNSTEYEMLIFDRWGNMIFRSDDLNKGWDGKANQGDEKAQQDVYIYRITVTDFRGKKMPPYIGSVTILR